MLESQKRGISNLERLQGQGYEYQLENYTSGLSELSIKAYKTGSQGHFFRVIFQTTLYVQIPIHWGNGDFHLATSDRHAILMETLGLSPEQKEQLLLFTALPSKGTEILILCHKVLVSQEIPFP
ncbi:MAG: hypothetical protein HYZ49_07540 [Chloroflexi bacterium]|nr:hypothetical protein [Chloroflexota bacterium]